jgi:nucleotide-binding universal stress UspA family protein
MRRRILVPLDGSAFAEAALPAAAAIGQRTEGRLELVMVHQPQLIRTNPTAAMDLEARIRRGQVAYLAEQAGRVTRSGVPVTSVVLDGPVVSTLVTHARAAKADLVVMSTHGRSGISRFFLGSTADRLVRGLHCPILLVRPAQATTARELGEGPRILIPLDGSALAETIVNQLGTALPGTATLELIRVVVPPGMMLPPMAGATPPIAGEVLEEELASADQYLQAVAGRLRTQGFAVRAAVVPDLSPAAAIAARAEECRCDGIAIATRGLGGLERALLGSVADKVIRAAQVPVLVWNPPAEVVTRRLHVKEASGADHHPGAVVSEVDA